MSVLSRAFIDRSLAARQRLADAYAWHRALWQAFPGQDGEPRRFLFRVDDQHEVLRVLLLSEAAPVDLAWCCWETRQVAPGFLDHERFAFDLRANPTVKRAACAPDGTLRRQGRRVGIHDDAQLREWLVRKGAQSGFTVDADQLMVGAPVADHFTQPAPQLGGRARRGKHMRVDFQGVLQVTDAAAFAVAFRRGIGSAKAFGFGLLMLQPLA